MTVLTVIWLSIFGKQVFVKCIVYSIDILKLPASDLGHFDQRCAMGNFNWRKIIDVWRKWCAMRLAQVLGNGVG